MRIHLVKFGKVLISRPAGKEAFLAIRPTLDPNAGVVEIDFSGIISFSPSWADEFFVPLFGLFGTRLRLAASDNLSVRATLSLLEKIHNIKFTAGAVSGV